MNDALPTPPLLRRWARMLLAPAVLVLLCALAYWFPLPGRGSARVPEKLVISSSCLDFGEVWENKSFVWPLVVQNPTTEDVKIREFGFSCSCTGIEPKGLTIPAGESREIRLTIDLRARKEADLTADLRSFDVTIDPQLGEKGTKSSRLAWTIRGRVRSAIRLEQRIVDLGRHSEASQPLASQEVLVTSFVPLHGITATADTPDLQVSVAPKAETPGQFRVVISPKTFEIGAIDAKITLVPQQTEHQPLPGKTLTVVGRIVNDIEISPPSAAFGARPVGEVVEETVSLRSLTGRQLEVTGTTVDGDGLIVERGARDESSEPRFLLRQRIAKKGEQTNRITMTVRTAGAKEAQVVLEVSYLGTDPGQQ
jgi:hypothetical protein